MEAPAYPSDPMLRLLPLVFLVHVLGCNPATSLVENAIQRELPALIGPAEDYAVQIDGLRLSAHEADRVTVVGTRVQPPDAPLLDRLVLVLDGVRYDPDSKRLERVARTTAEAQVRPADLEAYLNTLDGIHEATVGLQPPDGATLRIRPALRGFTLPRGVTPALTGRLRADDGRVHFDIDEVRAAGLPLGAAVARRLSAALNPVLDLTGTELDLRVTAVRVDTSALHLHATGDVAGLRRRPAGTRGTGR